MRRKKGGRGRPKSGTTISKACAKKDAELSTKLIDSASPEPDISVLGYTQTGPSSYRVGSTHVLLGGSEDDIQPIFRDCEIILEVECGSNSALMYLSRLCQGSKGQCIEFEGAWISPNDFQMLSGRETAKDWKRSIRHYGRSLKLLINKGILTIHPTACRCDSCRLLTQTNACEPPRKIDQSSAAELKKQRKLKTADESDESLTKNKNDSEIKSASKTPFDFESDGSKVDSDSSEPHSPGSSVSEELLSTLAPKATSLNDHIEETQTAKSEPTEDHDSDSDCDQPLQIVDEPETKQGSLDLDTDFSTKVSNSDVEREAPVCENSDAEDDSNDDVDDVADDQSSDTTDDTPLSLLKTSLKQEEDKSRDESPQQTVQGITVKDEKKEPIDSRSEQLPVDFKEKVILRSPEKPHGQHREARLSNIINNLRSSKEKSAPVTSQQRTMNDTVFPTTQLLTTTPTLNTDRNSPDETKDEALTAKDLEMGEIRRNSTSGTGIDSVPMTPSTVPQPIVPPPYFGVPFDPQYPMLGLSLQHLFAQNLANSYGMNGVSLPPNTSYPDLHSRSKQTLKSPAATMTKEEYDKQKSTSPTSPSNQQPRFTSSPVGSTSSKGSAQSLSSPTLSAEKAAVMAKLTEKLAKISEKPPEVIDKTVKSVIKRAKRMQQFEKLQAKLKKSDFVSPIAGKSNKEYYRDRSPERQPQRYGDPDIRRDKKQLTTNPPPAHQHSKLSSNTPPMLPSPGLPFGYPVSPEMIASMPHLPFPLPSLQMWQSCFPFTMPPPGLETTRFTQFFHNLNNGFMGNAALKRSLEESVVDLSSKKQRLSYSDSYQDSKSELLVTSLQTMPRMNSVPHLASSPNNSSRSPESNSSSPFLSNGPQLNSRNGSPVFSSVSSLTGQGSMKIDENDNSIEDAHEVNYRGHKLNGSWSDSERSKTSTECTCDYKNIDDIRSWSTEDVCRFMKRLDGCSPYIDTFRRAGVDGSSLPLLTTDSLTKSLGMKLGPALVLTGAVARKAREISKIVPCSYCRKKIQRG
ncbi:hypothetical protein LOTGIDRAFT_229327 [Lottia gigantea]|uniref:SAM domain-containing protein n=1 Tax=Lottia gigantea TaxID=225164 RepID=V3ZX32_LOTGI|nr:hypothetical protein LOTGIDRAFT_229327 [Lottia gigantea]ESO87185.1 hypothetical protein LOTGIDRAFT_229327 [Lottia gigantea]